MISLVRRILGSLRFTTGRALFYYNDLDIPTISFRSYCLIIKLNGRPSRTGPIFTLLYFLTGLA